MPRSSVSGFLVKPELIHWYLGGLSYIVGALIYIARFPERFKPGMFDIIVYIFP